MQIANKQKHVSGSKRSFCILQLIFKQIKQDRCYSIFIESIFLNYRKTIATHSRCTFPPCETPTDRLRLISRSTRFKAIKTRKLYIPEGSRACHRHFNDTNWDINSINSMEQFNQKQIEDME